MTDVEIVARAIMIAKGGACNVTDWAERYRNLAVAEAWDAATAALAAATPLIEARIVAWLRINQDPNSYDVTNEIERGDHLKGNPNE